MQGQAAKKWKKKKENKIIGCIFLVFYTLALLLLRLDALHLLLILYFWVHTFFVSPAPAHPLFLFVPTFSSTFSFSFISNCTSKQPINDLNFVCQFFFFFCLSINCEVRHVSRAFFLSFFFFFLVLCISNHQSINLEKKTQKN